MNTILLHRKQQEEAGYKAPPQWVNNIYKIHPAVPRKKSEGVDFDIYDFEMLFNDEKVKELLRTGQTIGCFYIESPGMRSLMRRLQTESFEMLTAASSIIRPGVAESGMMQEFIERHKNPARRTYLVPQMEELLGETYGVMVYQEDVIKVAHHIAGLSLEEADLLRRAMSGKMRSHKAMERVTAKFYESCKAKGLPDNIARELWRQIASFAGYSFCKAHSASFALLSYQVAYLKAHYPAEFMASVLSNGGGFYAHAAYIWECKRMGLKVELPCINNSNYEYMGEGKTLQIGLMAIKRLTKSSIDIIVSEREENGKYISLIDFLIRTRLGFEETSSLIRCGAMRYFKKTRITLMRLLDIYFKRRKIFDEGYNDLFMDELNDLEKYAETDENYSCEAICRAEYEAFDYMVTRHPLFFFKDFFERPGFVKSKDLPNYMGKNIKMIGWYIASKRIRTKKGDIMKFLSLEDLTGTYEAVLFPKAYDKFVESTLSMGPYYLEGRVDLNDSHNLIVENLELLTNVKVKESNFKDSVDHNYYGDVENVTLDEISLVEKLGKEKLRIAYAS